MTRLPRGRHGLSRADVAGRQRARILAAFAEVLTERGYVNTPVAAIIARAGVSRETFYQQFSSKQDCFVAALEQTVGGLTEAMTRAATDPDAPPLARFDAMLGAYLHALGAQPSQARLFLVETYAVGPEAVRRRLELQRSYVEGIAAIFAARTAAQRFACEALVAAIISLVTARILTDDLTGLEQLRAPLVDLAGSLLT